MIREGINKGEGFACVPCGIFFVPVVPEIMTGKLLNRGMLQVSLLFAGVIMNFPINIFSAIWRWGLE